MKQMQIRVMFSTFKAFTSNLSYLITAVDSSLYCENLFFNALFWKVQPKPQENNVIREKDLHRNQLFLFYGTKWWVAEWASFQKRWSERVLRFLGSFWALLRFGFALSQNKTINTQTFFFFLISHKPKIPRNYDVSSYETHFGCCPCSRRFMFLNVSCLFGAASPQGFSWVTEDAHCLLHRQIDRSLRSQQRFLRPWPHWPPPDSNASSCCWPHAAGPWESQLGPSGSMFPRKHFG